MADEVPGMAPSALSVPSDCRRSRKVRLWLCHRFGWHRKEWVSLHDSYDTCTVCGKRFYFNGTRTG